MARNAILFILAAQQPRRAGGIVRRMAGDARIGGHGVVTSQQGLRRNLAGERGVRAGGPIGQRVDLAAHLPGGIVAGQAQLAAGTVFHQKILRNQVFGLHMRIVARRALDVAFDQLHRSGWIGGLAIRASDATRSILSFKGSARLNGCDDCMLLPNTSAVYIDPRVVTCP